MLVIHLAVFGQVQTELRNIIGCLKNDNRPSVIITCGVNHN